MPKNRKKPKEVKRRRKGLGSNKRQHFFTFATSGQQEAGAKKPVPRRKDGEEYYKRLHFPIASHCGYRERAGGAGVCFRICDPIPSYRRGVFLFS